MSRLQRTQRPVSRRVCEGGKVPLKVKERGRGRAWRRKREESQAAGEGAARRRQRWRVFVDACIASTRHS